jgi:integrase
MHHVNPCNEREKQRYFRHMKEARGLADKIISIAERAIAEYEEATGGKDFRAFTVEDAIAFKRRLLANGGRRAAELSSRSTVHGKLRQVQNLFRWLSQQPGFRSKIQYGDADYLNLSERDVRIARAVREKPTPTLEQVHAVLEAMPSRTDCEKRDRALIACTALTGIRVAALVSLKLIRGDRAGIDQDARDVATKFGKSFPTFFFHVGGEVRTIFLEWVDYLGRELLFGEEDPLFPASEQKSGPERQLVVVGLSRRHWLTTDPARDAFRRAFTLAGLPYFSPHSFRRTLTRHGQQVCTTPEEMKAWSQNLGHDEVSTTLRSYGAVPGYRQAEIIAALPSQTERTAQEEDRELRKRLLALLAGSDRRSE